MNKQKILIPIDGSAFSHQIFPTIRSFFRPEATELILLEVLDPLEQSMIDTDIVAASNMIASAVLSGGAGYAEREAEIEERRYQANQAIQHQHEEMLAASAKALDDAGYIVKTHAEIGEPAEQIVGYAETAGVDLIAMVTHGRGGLSKLVMGSFAERVLHNAPVPVLIVRPSPESS